jgi:hypothetical protein
MQPNPHSIEATDTSDTPELSPVSRQQFEMTRHWWVWLVVAAALLAGGWVPLIFGDPGRTARPTRGQLEVTDRGGFTEIWDVTDKFAALRSLPGIAHE